MLDHILVPLDHSQLAEQALNYASAIVNDEGQITLLSVVEETIDVVYNNDIFATAGGIVRRDAPPKTDIRQPAEDYLHQVAYRIARPHVKIVTLVLMGKPADVIIDTAKNMNVNAIVMSTHGRTGITRWMYGSVTQKVLAAAPCPVFVIPSQMFS